MNLLTLVCCAFIVLNLTKVESVHLFYNFTVAYMQGAPDGVPVDILAVNNQFPGPEIRCKLGDTVHVTVTNQIKDRQNKKHPLGVHWHGLLQYGTIFADGPDHVTQCPITFGKSYEYVITPNQTGTYWWHSHTSWQYSEGMWGVFIVDNPNEPYKDYYSKELTFTLNDWYHISGKANTDWYMSNKSDARSPIPDSAMLNGRGFYPCSVAALQGLPCKPQQPYVFEVRRNERYRVRIINTSALLTFQFYIQEHTRFYVIEVDGVDTVPVPIDTLLIAPAQRYSIIVEMNERPGSYAEEEFLIHANMADIFNTELESPNSNLFPETIINYSGQPSAILKYKSEWNNGAIPKHGWMVPLKRATRAATRREWPAGGTPQEQLEYLMKNPKELRPGQEATPEPSSNTLRPGTVGSKPNVTDFAVVVVTSPNGFPNHGRGRAGTVSKTNMNPWVILDENNLQPFDRIPAPIHVDQEFRLRVRFIKDPVTGITYATFNGVKYKAVGKPIIFRMLQKKSIPATSHPLTIKYGKVIQVVITNPSPLPHPFHLHGHTFWVVGREPIGGNVTWFPMGVRRDTVVVDGLTSVYLRFVADNPGAWLFHCHINWHHQAGLAAVFIEARDETIELYQGVNLPPSALKLCKDAGITI